MAESPLLEYLEGGGSEHARVADGARRREHVQTPRVDVDLVLSRDKHSLVQ